MTNVSVNIESGTGYFYSKIFLEEGKYNLIFYFRYEGKIFGKVHIICPNDFDLEDLIPSLVKPIMDTNGNYDPDLNLVWMMKCQEEFLTIFYEGRERKKAYYFVQDLKCLTEPGNLKDYEKTEIPQKFGISYIENSEIRKTSVPKALMHEFCNFMRIKVNSFLD